MLCGAVRSGLLPTPPAPKAEADAKDARIAELEFDLRMATEHPYDRICPREDCREHRKELSRLQERAAELEAELERERMVYADRIAWLEKERDAARAECASHLAYAKHLQSELGDTAEALSDSRASIQRLEAEAARMREALEAIVRWVADVQTPGNTIAIAVNAHATNALADTTAGCRALAVIEAARNIPRLAGILGHEQDIADVAELERALDAWDHGGETPPPIPQSASHTAADTSQKGEKTKESGGETPGGADGRD